MLSGESWKHEHGHDDDEGPKFGRKARTWFARSVAEKLQEKAVAQGGPCKEGYEYDVDAQVAWLVERADEFVKWESADTYHGSRYAMGGWVILWDKIDKAKLPRPEISLDEWLVWDIEKPFYSFRPVSFDSGGIKRLSVEQVLSLKESAAQRRRYWPRLCSVCKSEFRQSKGQKGRPRNRCESCIAKQRQAGAARRGAV